ncbi:unnamed protein product [Paramecium primaurelia]|uniref:B box-type domain-containing protein n=1 Tax=Paramecium primaurelia TaxID=5886 RepID=A0A8S1KFY0_PARPR|nr:unnamed protein product [Paramecium primaurelia]
MNNPQCQSCFQYIAIVTCKECKLSICFKCDERLHQDKNDNHYRTTISFQPRQILQSDNDEKLIEMIKLKKKELQELKDKESQLTKHYQDRMIQAKNKYEQQISALENRLQKAQKQMNEVSLENGELDVDTLQNELENLEKSLKSEIKLVEEEQRKLDEKTQKIDALLNRVKKATDIEQQQIIKMNEVVQIFKACSEQLQKEKDLLMLDNEKLIAEVEIFAKFFDENGPLMEELNAQKNNEQQ